MNVITTISLTKRFGTTLALDEVSIQIKQGEIHGLIGLNGAGKTTLFRLLLGMISPDKGHIEILGRSLTDGFNTWNDIGYLIETPHGYPNLTVKENLDVFCKYRNLEDPNLVSEVIHRLGLDRYASIKERNLSKGNKQRLGLAKALMHKPAVLILDEPSSGLDPGGIIEVREMLDELVQEGSTILLSSHILGEVSRIADRYTFLHGGKVVSELTKEELNQELSRKVLIDTNDNNSAKAYLRESGYTVLLNEKGELEVSEDAAIKHPWKMTQLLTEHGLPPRQIYLFTEELEDYFLRMIKKWPL